MNKKGFTLVELLVTIVISTLVLSLGTMLVNEMIEKNENKTITIAQENVKKGANLYSKEFFNEIVWLNNKSCISIEQLISKGYIRKDKAEKTGFKYVIIEKDDNNTIISERNSEGNSDDSNLCGTIIYKQAFELKNKDICKNLKYDGTSRTVHISKNNSEDIDKINDIDDVYILPDSDVTRIYPGSYDVSISLKEGYKWNDGSIGSKKVYCTIQKGVPELKLFDKDDKEIYRQDSEQTIPIEVTVSSDVPGNIELKSSNNKYATVELSESNGKNDYSLEYSEVKNKYVKIITIKNYANRNTNTYITIKHNPTDPNYQSTSTTYTIGKITDIKIDKVTDAQCIETYYNTKLQTITKDEGIGYTLSDAQFKEVGSYDITASLHPGFEWEDGSTGDVTFQCEILPLTYKIKYNGNGNTGGSMTPSEHKYGVSKKLAANGFTKKGYTFVGWSTSSTGTVTYTNEALVENLINPETDANGTEVTLYAQWRINKVYIKYSTNGGNITSQTTENGLTSTWTKDTNNIIYQATSSQPATSTFYVYDYGSSTTSAGLANWNNPSYINISKNGYGAKSGEQWICLSGDCSKNKTYDHSKVYAASDFCDASNGNCTAVLGVNWVDNVKPTCTITKRTTNWDHDGVDITVNCSDSGSGCTKASENFNNLKEDKTYSVTDNAGNSESCSVSISSRKMWHKRTRTWNDCATTTTKWKGTCIILSPLNLKGTHSITGAASEEQCRDWCDDKTTGAFNIDCTSYSVCTGGYSSWGSWSGYTYTSNCSNGTTIECKYRTEYK